MPKAFRVLSALAVLTLGACAGNPEPVQLAGPMDSIGRAPRPAASRLGTCTMPVLDNPALATLLVSATMAGPQPMLAATAFECHRRPTLS